MKDTLDITPDTKGLLRFIRHLAESDRHTAKMLLISGTKEGWHLSNEQLEEILDGNSLEVTG